MQKLTNIEQFSRKQTKNEYKKQHFLNIEKCYCYHIYQLFMPVHSTVKNHAEKRFLLFFISEEDIFYEVIMTIFN